MAGQHAKLPAMMISDPAILARVMALMCEAIALRGAEQPEAALAVLDQALALDPAFLPVHMQRAELLEQLARWEAAVAAYDACLDIAPDFADAISAQRRALEALAGHCRSRLAEPELAPSQQIALRLLLGQTLLKLDHPETALAETDAALLLAADALPVRALHADILLRLNRHEEALRCYPDRPAGPSPAPSDAARIAVESYNRSDILWRMGELAQAQASVEQALRWQPEFAQARVAQAHLLLMQEDYQRGWAGHEARFGIAELARRVPAFDSPPWRRGEVLAGKHVLLWAEQGQGDTLQFARYISVVAARAERVSLCAPASLLPLLAASFPGIDCVSLPQQAAPHDLHASLLSLPWLLDLPHPRQSPAPPYLRVDPQAVQDWRLRLDAELGGPDGADRRRPRIGLAWAGRQYATIHHSRDLPLAELAPLMALPVDLVSLQREIPRNDGATHAALGPRLLSVALADWADTAALAGALDLVISVDTAVAHLAAALGRPTWLALRRAGEWRWGLQQARTDWYPTMRLFRQHERGQWATVVQEMVAACRAQFL